MTYQEALDKINSRLLFGMRPGLERIQALMSRLGDPQKKLRCVHVCGTNGKGTVCTLVSSALQESGCRTGLNISPYVLDFRERFQIDGEMISKEELSRQMDEIWPQVEALDREGIEVSEFELVTAVALNWFAEKQVDAAVIEVGMGGLYDATNVIPTPEAAVVMSISLDHTVYLGDTVEEIAREKSGIIKEGGRVVLYPDQQPGVREVIEGACKTKGASLTVPDMAQVKALREDIHGTDFQAAGKLWEGRTLHTPFLGRHQLKNAAAALAVLDILHAGSFPQITGETVARGFQKAFIPARMEILSEEPLCLLDGGHNPGCAQVLRDALETYLPRSTAQDTARTTRRVAIMGMMADKDSASALNILGPCFDRIVTVRPENPRSLSAEDLARTASAHCGDVQAAGSPEEAVELARKSLLPGDALIVCGSFYMAAELRPILRRVFSPR